VDKVVIWLAAAGTLLALAGLAGGLRATWKTSGLEATVARLRGEIDDYLKFYNYAKPRLDVLEQQNKLLLEMHNPADAIEKLYVQEGKNHLETIGVLRQLHKDLVKNGGRS
jgi:DNA polymerase III delta prime subunit